jgi:hypothetical protein
MISGRAVISIAIIVLPVFTVQMSRASEASLDIKSYSRLIFSACSIQDQLPLKPTQPLERPLVEICNTEYKAVIDLYFVAGNVKAPAFGRARFNLQDNHVWREINTEYHVASFSTAEEYHRAAETANTLVEEFRPLSPELFNYAETEMPRDSIIATWFEVPGGVKDLLVQVLRLPEESLQKMIAPPLSQVHISIPQIDFAKASGEFPVQARISFDYFNFAERSNSILYRKMFYGLAKTAPLGSAESVMLSHLLTLRESKCHDLLEDWKRQEN